MTNAKIYAIIRVQKRDTKGIDTMTYRYNVNAHFEKAETTLKTNDICVAIQEFIDCLEDDIHCDIMDGFTGEILAIANDPGHPNYATDEMVLMILGYLWAERWEEEDDDDDDDNIVAMVCGRCGGDVDTSGKCLCCGTIYH